MKIVCAGLIVTHNKSWHDNARDYVFFNSMNPVLVDDKQEMERLEDTINKEISTWQTKYNEILPTLYSATSVVSHSEYDELYKMIKWTNDYPDPKF